MSNLASCPVAHSHRKAAPERRAGGADALSITELYSRVDRVLRMAFSQEVWITGEIRTIKVLPRGHCFIDLVDPTNARDTSAPTLNVKCWSTRWRAVRSTLDSLGIALDAGMIVRVRGRVEFYKARGTVDFILSDLDTDALARKGRRSELDSSRHLSTKVSSTVSECCQLLLFLSDWDWWPALAPRVSATSWVA